MKAVTAVSFIAAALLTFAGLAGAQGLSDADREFVKEAAQGGVAEVELGNLAMQRASRPVVKEFGAKMVKDHGAANAELATLAQAKGVAVPTTVGPTHQALRDRLSALQGTEFDRAYMQEMVKDHTQDVAEFEKASQTATDPDIRGWAAAKLPTLREHLALARDVNSQVVLGPAPAPVVVAPAALPAAVVVPWCAGAYAPAAGSNFGTCAPVIK
jgi:putative membrane protein